MNIMTSFKDNEDKSVYVSLGCLTSNKDHTTIILTDKQYINKLKRKLKATTFRTFAKL
jgi:hypothetical protein